MIRCLRGGMKWNGWRRHCAMREATVGLLTTNQKEGHLLLMAVDWAEVRPRKVKPWRGNYCTYISKHELQRPCLAEWARTTPEGVLCLSELCLSAPEPIPLLVRSASRVSQDSSNAEVQIFHTFKPVPLEEIYNKILMPPHSYILAFNWEMTLLTFVLMQWVDKCVNFPPKNAYYRTECAL